MVEDCITAMQKKKETCEELIFIGGIVCPARIERATPSLEDAPELGNWGIH